MGAKGQTSILDITVEGKSRGKLIVRIEKLTQSNCNFIFKLRIHANEIQRC